MYVRIPPSLALAIYLLFVLVQKNFVQVVRAVELCLGMIGPGSNIKLSRAPTSMNEAMTAAAASKIFSAEVSDALRESIPIITKLASQIGLNAAKPFPNFNRDPITTRYTNFKCMDRAS